MPAALDSLPALESLHLSGNRLTGCVPEGLWYVPDNDFDRLGLPFCTVDRAVLVALYDATGGTNWTNNTNWLTDAPMGQWHGVTTDVSGRVTQLDLDNNGLTGQLPPELDNLDKLEMLALSGNLLTGCVPVRLRDVSENDFGRLGLPFCSVDRAALIALYNATDGPNWEINTNWLSDRPIGEWSGVSAGFEGGRFSVNPRGRVKELSFYDNRMTGSIPPEIGSLSNLEMLNIPGNRLRGSIPPEIGNLERLWWLNLGSNELTGEIPPELGRLSNLQGMYLGSNQLSGPIPTELGGLGNLEHLVLSGNRLTGEIPSELGGLGGLMQLRLAENRLSGPIPSELGGLSKLRRWRLGGNRLTGCVPQGLAAVKNNDISGLGLNICGDGQATPTPTPAPRYPVVTQSEEYGYTIDIPDDWVEEDGYVRGASGGKLFVREVDLAAGATLDRFAESVRDNLRQEWSSEPLYVFEITSFGKRRLGDQDFYWMEYRVQESPKYCLLDVVELIALGSSLPGPPKGFRAIHRACDWELPGELDSTRRETLESFRVVTRPAAYYSQFIYVPGATIKAAGKVDHFAMQEAAKLAAVMLGGRRDVVDCLERRGSALAIVPDGDPVTALPEFAYLKGTKDHWGQPRDGTTHPWSGGGARPGFGNPRTNVTR